MKHILSVFVLSASLSFAGSLECGILDAKLEKGQPNPFLGVTYLKVGADKRVTSKIVRIDFKKEKNQWVESKTTLFSRNIRGGYTIGYCTNSNGYSKYSQTYSLSSQCMVKNSNDKVYFLASFGTKKKGDYRATLIGRNVAEDKFKIDVCEEVD